MGANSAVARQQGAIEEVRGCLCVCVELASWDIRCVCLQLLFVIDHTDDLFCVCVAGQCRPPCLVWDSSCMDSSPWATRRWFPRRQVSPIHLHTDSDCMVSRLCVHQINEFFFNGFLISCQASRAAVFGAVCLTVGVAGCVFHCESEDQYVTSSCSWSVLALSVFSCICLWLFVQLDRLLNFAVLLLLFMLFLCYCVCFRFDICCYLSFFYIKLLNKCKITCVYSYLFNRFYIIGVFGSISGILLLNCIF